MGDRPGTPYPDSRRGSYDFRNKKNAPPATPPSAHFPRSQRDQHRSTPREQEIFDKISWRRGNEGSTTAAQSTSSPVAGRPANQQPIVHHSTSTQPAAQLPTIIQPQSAQTASVQTSSGQPASRQPAIGSTANGPTVNGPTASGQPTTGPSASTRPRTAMDWLPSHVPRKYKFQHYRNAESLKPGMILMVQHIGPNLDYEVKAEHPSRGWIDNCGPVYGKMRSGIVARIYHGWVTLVMLYTSNGNGMERKPPNVREDAIPVVYHADKRRLELRAARKPYLATLCKMVKTNHHAYMTRPVNVILDTPIAIVGSLTSASVNRVLHYYQAYSDKGTLSLAGQIRWTLPVPVLEAISPPLGATEDHKGFTEVLSDSTRRILDSRKASTDRSNQRQAELRKSPLFGGFSSLPEEGDNGEEGDEEEDEEYESEVEREP